MRWHVKETPWAVKKYAFLPTKLLGEAGWVWLECYWEGRIGTPYGDAIYKHETKEALQKWCDIPKAKDIEAVAQKLFDENKDSQAAPWNLQWEKTREHWRDQARQELETNPRTPR